jgi:hypothetical protein
MKKFVDLAEYSVDVILKYIQVKASVDKWLMIGGVVEGRGWWRRGLLLRGCCRPGGNMRGAGSRGGVIRRNLLSAAWSMPDFKFSPLFGCFQLGAFNVDPLQTVGTLNRSC